MGGHPTTKEHAAGVEDVLADREVGRDDIVLGDESYYAP
jgi:hypothetical protein